jgi:hypothetical protein
MIQFIPEVAFMVGTSAGYVYAIWVRIETESGRVIFRQCHFYIVNAENCVDLFKVSLSGRLEKFAYLNNVRAVEEVDAPPAVEPPPTPAVTV